MKRIILLLSAILMGYIVPAQNLVWMQTENIEKLKEMFFDESLNIHYYTDDFVIASSQKYDASTMTLLDKNAFGEGKSYYLIYCPKEEQEAYQKQNEGAFDCLMEAEHYLIVKPTAAKIQAYKEDGVVAIDNKKARLVETKYEFPEITAEDTNIRILMSQMSQDSMQATIQHMQNYSSRQHDNDTVYLAEKWLKEEYEKMGLEVFKQDFRFEAGGVIHETSDNIIALQRGTLYPDEYVICGAHYDSFSKEGKAPGADDNASGTAGIIETARILSKYKFERSILYCGWAAEEIGLRGSEAFATQAEADSLNIVAYLNLDMTGYLQEDLDIRIDMIYISLSNPLAVFYKAVCNTYFPTMNVIRNWLVNGDSDHSSFHRHGFMSMFPFERVETRSPYIHTSKDTIGLSVNNMAQVFRFSELNLACVATLSGYIGGTNVNENFSNIDIFPNPTQGKLNIISDKLKAVFVYDHLGRQVMAETATEGTHCEIQTINWQPGIYIIHVLTQDGKSYSNKVIVK